MSSVGSVQQLRDLTNDTTLAVEATNALLHLNVNGEPSKRRHPETHNPPPVPPPTRSSTPAARREPSSKQGHFTFAPPLTPADFSSVDLTSPSPESTHESSVNYYFMPPLTPFDFQLGTSELWNALDSDLAETVDFDFEFDSPPRAQYAVFQARARCQQQPSLTGLWDQSVDFQGRETPEKKHKDQTER